MSASRVRYFYNIIIYINMLIMYDTRNESLVVDFAVLLISRVTILVYQLLTIIRRERAFILGNGIILCGREPCL